MITNHQQTTSKPPQNSKKRPQTTSKQPQPPITATIYEKIKIQSFKDDILQNLCENIIEIFDAELATLKLNVKL